jgi:hypothetical protein
MISTICGWSLWIFCTTLAMSVNGGLHHNNPCNFGSHDSAHAIGRTPPGPQYVEKRLLPLSANMSTLGFPHRSLNNISLTTSSFTAYRCDLHDVDVCGVCWVCTTETPLLRTLLCSPLLLSDSSDCCVDCVDALELVDEVIVTWLELAVDVDGDLGLVLALVVELDTACSSGALFIVLPCLAGFILGTNGFSGASLPWGASACEPRSRVGHARTAAVG